jgi:hypothetical protein
MSTFTYRIVDGEAEVSKHEAPSYAGARNDALDAFGRIISDARHQKGEHWKQLSLELTDGNGLKLLCLEFSAIEGAAVLKTPSVD